MTVLVRSVTYYDFTSAKRNSAGPPLVFERADLRGTLSANFNVLCMLGRRDSLCFKIDGLLSW